MSLLHRLAGFGAVLVVALLATPSAAKAQDCGEVCASCGFLAKEGREHQNGGIGWNMNCTSWTLNCTACGDARVNGGSSAEDLLATLRSGAPSAVSAAIVQSRGRLRVSTDRNLVVLFGTKCDPKAVSAVVYVSAARAKQIASSGVAPLREATQPSGVR